MIFSGQWRRGISPARVQFQARTRGFPHKTGESEMVMAVCCGSISKIELMKHQVQFDKIIQCGSNYKIELDELKIWFYF
jgi:hypothetical protein